MLNFKQIFWLGVGLTLLGVIWFIVSIFNLKNDPAWISITIVSVVAAFYGVCLVDRGI